MLPEHLSSTFKTAAQGLNLQKKRIEIASANIANSRSTATEGGGHIYRPQTVRSLAPAQEKFVDVFANSIRDASAGENDKVGGSAGESGLGPDFVVEQENRFRYEYDPGHPDADENGMVKYPDVDLLKEMTEMISANRLYEANLSSIEAAKEIQKRAMEI
jgi:flagellar basal-body rod protein FlgC